MSQVPTGYLLQSTSAFPSVCKVKAKQSLMGCRISAMWHHEWDPGTEIGLCCSVIQSCPTLYDPLHCGTPGFPVLHCLPEFAQTHVHWVGDAIQQCLSLLFLPSIFPYIRVFPNELALRIRWCFGESFHFHLRFKGFVNKIRHLLYTNK